MRTVAGVGGGHPNPRAPARLGTATKRLLWVAIAVASIVTSGLTATAAADSSAPTDDSRSPLVVDGPLDAHAAGSDARLVEVGATREAATRDAADGYTVFRPYGSRGGLKDEFEQLAAEHPRHHQAGHDRRDRAGPGHRRPQGVAARQPPP